jgi:alpha-tubulin suppressor-like RCC1 family protein
VNVFSIIIYVGIGVGDLSYCWAITSANRLKVWGWNSYGVLGVGDTVNRSTPLDPIGWIDESGVQTTSGDPPFQGKIVKVITAKTFAGGPSNIGRPEMVVLDEDGGVWCAGENRTLAAGPIAADTNLRFKRASLGAVAPNDKIVDIHMQGNSANGADIRLFALTQQGKLLMSGTNNWDLGTAMPGTSSSSYRAVFLQPVRLGV